MHIYCDIENSSRAMSNQAHRHHIASSSPPSLRPLFAHSSPFTTSSSSAVCIYNMPFWSLSAPHAANGKRSSAAYNTHTYTTQICVHVA